jgi:integration host factor subunit beta
LVLDVRAAGIVSRYHCSIFVKKYGGYTGRNHKAGEKVKINPKKLPFFKAGEELKERVDR